MTLACGKRIPDSEHAVSLSLPTLRDVIGYEEKSAEVFRHVCSGYPRFVRHWTVGKVQAHLHGATGTVIVALQDQATCRRLMEFLGRDLTVLENLPFGAVVLPEIDLALADEVRCFIQHTGTMLSSRQAEDYLITQGLLDARQPEMQFDGSDPAQAVRETLAGIYGVHDKQVSLYPTGMNAYFSVFDAIHRQQRMAGREEWLQVGWLYLDTTAILDRFAARYARFPVADMDVIEDYLRINHTRMAGVTTEIQTNPLLQTPDLQRLGAAAHRYGLPLIVDVSMPASVNVDVFPYADVVIESLTKFASGHADVMAGAAVFNAASEWGGWLRANVVDGCPYMRDLRRLAHSVQGYVARMMVINANAQALTAFFRSSRRVRQVHWANGERSSSAAYEAIRRPGGGCGGVISVVFEKPLAEVYDRLPLLKGPSFGTEFTLCMAYVYMAHYDLVKTTAGQVQLRANGIDPELLRISVGMEPVEDVIRAFEQVL